MRTKQWGEDIPLTLITSSPHHVRFLFLLKTGKSAFSLRPTVSFQTTMQTQAAPRVHHLWDILSSWLLMTRAPTLTYACLFLAVSRPLQSLAYSFSGDKSPILPTPAHRLAKVPPANAAPAPARQCWAQVLAAVVVSFTPSLIPSLSSARTEKGPERVGPPQEDGRRAAGQVRARTINLSSDPASGGRGVRSESSAWGGPLHGDEQGISAHPDCLLGCPLHDTPPPVTHHGCHASSGGKLTHHRWP